MVIDPSLYEGSCIVYATSFLTKEGHEDVEGIYLGSTENGKPEVWCILLHNGRYR